MKTNMGIADRVLRSIVAIVAIVLYFTGVVTGPLGITLLVVAGVFLLVSSIGFCPLYLPLRITTRNKNE